jgi:hypothetical protein
MSSNDDKNKTTGPGSSTGPAASTAPTRARTAPEGGQGDGNREQVEDHGTTKVSADEVANAAAKSLHGGRAVPEKFAQPDAVSLVGGSTLISDPDGENPAAGERR